MVGLDDGTRPAGIKGQCLSSRFSLFLRLHAGVHQSPRAVAFMNSEGRFRRLFHVEQRRIPLRCLLSSFRINSVLRIADPRRLVSPVSPSPPPSPFVRVHTRPPLARTPHRSTVAIFMRGERRGRATSKSRLWIVGGHPPFVPRVTTVPARPPLCRPGKHSVYL